MQLASAKWIFCFQPRVQKSLFCIKTILRDQKHKLFNIFLFLLLYRGIAGIGHFLLLHGINILNFVDSSETCLEVTIQQKEATL